MGMMMSVSNVKPESTQSDSILIDRGERSKVAKAKRMVFIEGNISSGKSTLVRNLKEKGLKVFEEDVKALTEEYCDEQGRNLLDLFYSDMKGYAFKLQMVSLTVRWRVILRALEALKDPNTDIVFVERSMLTDKYSFAINLRETGHIDALEWQIYMTHLESHIRDTAPHLVGIDTQWLYLRTDPDVCYKRKIGRGRVEESSIPLDYLNMLHAKHDQWLGSSKAFHVDGNKDQVSVIEAVLAMFM